MRAKLLLFGLGWVYLNELTHVGCGSYRSSAQVDPTRMRDWVTTSTRPILTRPVCHPWLYSIVTRSGSHTSVGSQACRISCPLFVKKRISRWGKRVYKKAGAKAERKQKQNEGETFKTSRGGGSRRSGALSIPRNFFFLFVDFHPPISDDSIQKKKKKGKKNKKKHRKLNPSFVSSTIFLNRSVSATKTPCNWLN